MPLPVKNESAPSVFVRAQGWFAKYYKKQIDGTGLAVFRILFFTVQLAEILHIYYFRHLIFDVVPFVQPYEISLAIPLLIWAATTFLLIIGLFTRPAAVANYFFTLLFFASFQTYLYDMFRVYQYVGFLLLFLPVARCLSFDRLLLKLKYSNTRFRYQPARTVSQLAYYVPVVIGLAFVYLDSTCFKLMSPMWLAGLGMWVPASLPFVTHLDATLLINSELLVKFMGYFSMSFEFLFLFLFPFRRYRTILMVIGVTLHLGILLLFPIPLFALGFGCLYVLMVPVGFWRRLLARRTEKESLIFYYDGECPLCARTRVVIEHFDVRKAILFRSVQGAAAQEPALEEIEEETLVDDIHSVDGHGRVYVGVDTYAQVLNAIFYLRPLSWFLRTPGIYHLAKAVYGFVAANRTTERCTEDNCGYVPPVVPLADSEFKVLQGVTLEDVKIKLAGTGLAFLVFLQCITTYHTPLLRMLRTKAGFETTAMGRAINSLTWVGRSFAGTFFGIVNHEVFLEGNFTGYEREFAVTYTTVQGVEQFLPIIRENGQPGPYLYGALWCKWNFRVVTAAPQQAAVEKGIRDFTAFWAEKHGVSLMNCRFNVKVKHIATWSHWQKDFLREQMSAPWQDAGQVVWKDKTFFSLMKPVTNL